MWPWCLCLRGWEAKNAFGRFEAWQTTRLHVIKRRLERLEAGFGVFACGVGGAKKAFGAFRGFEAWQTAGLNAKKDVALVSLPAGLGCQKGVWSVWRGLGVFACGVGVAKKAPWQTAHLNANKKLLVGPWCLCLQGWGCQKRVWQTAGLNVKKKLLMGPWCLCVRGWGCQKGVWSVWRV